MSVPSFTLAPGYNVSRIIKGSWQLAGGHGIVDRKQAIEDMFAFVDAGITTFDCADIYTGVEELIGEFLLEYTRSRGSTARELVNIHTKCVPDLDALSHVTKQYIENIVDRSLQRLKLERLNLVQFHWWNFGIPGHTEAFGHLHDLKEKGKIEHIGVTNYDVKHLIELLQEGFPVLSNQVQYSAIDQRPERSMVELCKEHNIGLLCYGSLAGGFLSEKYLGKPEPKQPLENRSLTKYLLVIEEFGGWEQFQQLLVVLKDIAAKHCVRIANVAMKYVLDKQCVVGIIVGARNTAHLPSLLENFTFSLDEDDANAIDAVLRAGAGTLGDIYSYEREKGGKHASIMKYNLNGGNA